MKIAFLGDKMRHGVVIISGASVPVRHFLYAVFKDLLSKCSLVEPAEGLS